AASRTVGLPVAAFAWFMYGSLLADLPLGPSGSGDASGTTVDGGGRLPFVGSPCPTAFWTSHPARQVSKANRVAIAVHLFILVLLDKRAGRWRHCLSWELAARYNLSTYPRAEL